jgi:hypothetical protein
LEGTARNLLRYSKITRRGTNSAFWPTSQFRANMAQNSFRVRLGGSFQVGVLGYVFGSLHDVQIRPMQVLYDFD